MNSPALLSAHGLECARGDRTLFTDMSFELAAGELLMVQGGNGQGKTSLLRLLTGLSGPVAGEVRWRGEAIAETRETFHAEMVYLAHANGIKEDLTPLENLRFQAGLAGRAFDADTAEQTLRKLGLARCLDLPARVLSFGQRRRVALAGLLIAGAVLWIMDEPLTGLDVHGVALVESLLREHLQGGGMVVMTTHQMLTLDGATVRTLQVGRQEDA